MNFNNTEFLKSAASESDFIKKDMPEVIFAGRSNVGKSSVINTLVRKKNLARVGETPGKTVFVNYFEADKKLIIVDLPGYGYAKTSFVRREQWAALIDRFFKQTGRLRLGVLIVDLRHGATALDKTMAEYFEGHGIPYIVAANKCDKVKSSELEEKKTVVSGFFNGRAESVILFSARSGEGREELLSKINAFGEGYDEASENVSG